MNKKGLVLVPRLRGIGGMETVIVSWIKHYQRVDDINMKFFAPQGLEDQSRFDGLGDEVKIAQLVRPHALGKAWGTWLTFDYLARHDFDFVVCTSIPLMKLAHLVRRVLHKQFKIISWFHFSIDTLPVSSNGDLLLADINLAISSGIKQQLIARGVSSDSIEVVYNPATIPDTVVAKREDTLAAQPLRLLYVGRIVWAGQKNLKLLLSALVEFKADWRLEIFGTGQQSDIDTLKSFVSGHELEDKVFVRGWSDSPFEHALPADYLILTSKYEGFPMVLIEAAGLGLPLISSDCPTGPDDIVVDDNGFLFTNDSQQDLVETLGNALATRDTFKPEVVRDSVEKFETGKYFERVSAILSAV
ncbi:group 1 glycosyl transferase [Lacticaseibacillus pantheris DSM 15945 = JCM 12539 = NBRC 106106]|jgi:UDP-D-galactose:(glucosyl)LPS alpha-1,6-D-galactosyltransferase|uniref:Group 1 glycosyl transferase n=2 Tax=Lacticaseibacillus pantheris TaxID=171523 RepID=A0A0R1TZ38_9LACO|nr:glycosyltransferase [Lacticaseibacillus pantheris]KRL86496.1 group 1 glycosyl transferase [Lacticaseibacillus pantheris DSM 15945 = JCM 12539 = NBRC 106106]